MTLVTRESILHQTLEPKRSTREARTSVVEKLNGIVVGREKRYFNYANIDYYYKTPVLLLTLCLYYFIFLIFETLVLVYFMLYYLYILHSFGQSEVCALIAKCLLN